MKTIDEIRAAFLRVHHYAMAIDELGDLRGQVETLRGGAEVALDATLELGAENQRLRERAEKAERERDETLHALELVREELTGADADWPSEAAEAQMVARVVKERDAARAEAAMLREALSALYTYPGVSDLLAPSGSLGSIRDAVNAALAASPGDWLAARDRALAAGAWNLGYHCAANPDASYDAKTQRDIDLDALVGGKS